MVHSFSFVFHLRSVQCSMQRVLFVFTTWYFGSKGTGVCFALLSAMCVRINNCILPLWICATTTAKLNSTRLNSTQRQEEFGCGVEVANVYVGCAKMSLWQLIVRFAALPFLFFLALPTTQIVSLFSPLCYTQALHFNYIAKNWKIYWEKNCAMLCWTWNLKHFRKVLTMHRKVKKRNGKYTCGRKEKWELTHALRKVFHREIVGAMFAVAWLWLWRGRTEEQQLLLLSISWNAFINWP